MNKIDTMPDAAAVVIVNMEKHCATNSRSLNDNEIGWERAIAYDSYLGTAAALIAAGIVEEHMLPGQPGRNKVSQTYRAGGAKGRGLGFLKIIKRGGRLFLVKKGIADEESDRRRDAWLQKAQLKRDITLKHQQDMTPDERRLLDAYRHASHAHQGGAIRFLEAAAGHGQRVRAPASTYLRLVHGATTAAGAPA